MRTWRTQLSATVSIAIFEPIKGWKIEAHAIPCVTFPENIPENLGRKSGALRNAFRDPRNAPKNYPENFSGTRSFRDFWETHACPEKFSGTRSFRDFWETHASSDLSLSGNEAEEDEDVGMYVVPNTLTTRHGRQIRAVVRLDL